MLSKQKVRSNKLIDNYQNNNNIDYVSSGYIVELFKIFNNIKDFCLIEKKSLIVYYVAVKPMIVWNLIIVFL